MRRNLPEAQRKDGELPTFPSREIAERELFAMRDESLGWLTQFARARGKKLELEPRALQSVEDLYFEIWNGGFLSRLRGDREKFELAMGMFWGAVAVAQDRASWSVREPVRLEPLRGRGAAREHFRRPERSRDAMGSAAREQGSARPATALRPDHRPGIAKAHSTLARCARLCDNTRTK
jgi:hypothetical protein